MTEGLPVERVAEVYPDHIKALAASLSSAFRRALPLQRIVDTNFLFLEEVIGEGVSVVEVASLLDQLGYAQLTGTRVNVKSLYSALDRARLSRRAVDTQASVPAPTAAGDDTGNIRWSEPRLDEALKPVGTVDPVFREPHSADDALVDLPDSTTGDSYFIVPDLQDKTAAFRKNSPFHSQLAKAVNILTRKEYENE